MVAVQTVLYNDATHIVVCFVTPVSLSSWVAKRVYKSVMREVLNCIQGFNIFTRRNKTVLVEKFAHYEELYSESYDGFSRALCNPHMPGKTQVAVGGWRFTEWLGNDSKRRWNTWIQKREAKAV